MTNVYVPQIPTRRNSATGELVDIYDISPARKFGEIIILTKGTFKYLDLAQIIPQMKDAMPVFNKGDYILAIGHPVMIAHTAIMAASFGHQVSMLYWDRYLGDYIPI